MEVGGPCTYSGCRRTAQFNSDFCSEHQNEVSHISINSDEVTSDEGPGINNQIIRFEIDGKKKTVDSKEVEHLLNRLKKAKKFWIVDLTVDENEFVQYAIEGSYVVDDQIQQMGKLEHWDRLEMIESKEMTTEDAFSTLRSKITGDYSGHELWWSEDGKLPSDDSTHGFTEEELDEQEKYAPLLIAAVVIPIVIFLGYSFNQNPVDVGEWVVAGLGELCCQVICGGILLGGGAGVSTLGRSDAGKFTK